MALRSPAALVVAPGDPHPGVSPDLQAGAGEGPGLPERNTYYIVTAMLMMSIVVVCLVIFRG